MGLDEALIPVLRLGERLPCRDRLERPRGGQHEVALQHLARFGIMTGQSERRDEVRIRPRNVVRIDRNRPASQFDRLVITLQRALSE